MKTKLVFEFDNPAAAKNFALWLCESGEQDYWTFMENIESDESGDVTGIKFDYHGGTNKASEFAKHPIIVTCGRLDKE